MNTRKLIAHCLLLLASTIFLLASCDEGVETDFAAQRGMPLPQGKYPLRFTAIQEGNAVQTRVTESADDPKSTLWTAGTDKIGVSIGTDGVAGQYTITATDGSSMTEVQPVYWQNTNPATIYGWYPATTDGLPKSGDRINLSDQSSGHLKFDFMKAESTKQYQYDSDEDISLPFKHQMAKMNIKLRSTDNLDLDGATVAIYGYTTCTFDKGNVTPGTSKGYLTACCTDAGKHVYRAMVAPIEQNELGGNFIKVTLKNSKEYYYKSGRKLEKNMLYSYTVDVREILSPGNAAAMNDIKGTVTIKGDGSETNNPITITDNATVTLQDVNIKVTTTDVNTTVIRVKDGKKLTLKVEGNDNRLEAVSGGGIVLEDGASIVVEGDGIDQSKLVVKAGKNLESDWVINKWVQASTVGIGAACGATCGNIEIKNLTLEVSGADANGGSGAAIGTSITLGKGSTVCGNITITNAYVTATSGTEAAAIGTGFSYVNGTIEQVGDITISGSTIVATVNPSSSGACIGLSYLAAGVTYTCGTITITCDDETAFLNNLKYTPSDTPNLGYKIGKGANGGGTGTIGAGSTFNGKSFANGYGLWQP